MDEIFLTKREARAAVSFLAVLKMLEKDYIDHRLNPRRTKDRLVVSESSVCVRISLSVERRRSWISHSSINMNMQV